MPEIKEMKFSDLNKVASCHIAAFPKSLSSAMGVKYVEKMLAWFLTSNKLFLFYLENENEVIGYCGGMVKINGIGGSSSGMLQHSFYAAIQAILLRPWLLFHEKMLSNFGFALKNITMKFRSFFKEPIRKARIESVYESSVGLIAIGVNPIYHGKGFGSMLLKEFEVTAEKTGITKLQLSVMSNNMEAIKSYARNGWKEVSRTSDSIKMTKRI